MCCSIQTNAFVLFYLCNVSKLIAGIMAKFVMMDLVNCFPGAKRPHQRQINLWENYEGFIGLSSLSGYFLGLPACLSPFI